jgi:hypothetical protein
MIKVKRRAAESAPEQTQKTIVGAIHPDVLRFTVGKDPVLDLELVEWDCIGTAAHVRTLEAMPVKPAIISRQDRNAVTGELVRVMRAAREGRFVSPRPIRTSTWRSSVGSPRRWEIWGGACIRGAAATTRWRSTSGCMDASICWG